MRVRGFCGRLSVDDEDDLADALAEFGMGPPRVGGDDWFDEAPARLDDLEELGDL